jgi:hypothetical protein
VLGVAVGEHPFRVVVVEPGAGPAAFGLVPHDRPGAVAAYFVGDLGHAVGEPGGVRLPDIPWSLVSSSKLLILLVVGPCGVFVVRGAGLEAAVQDPDEAVTELAERGAVTDAAGALLVVVGAGAG